MSRSYKKTPIVKDGHSGKFGKKVANRKVRHFKGDIANGKAYRKIYESWDIHDMINRYPLSQLRQEQEAEEKAIKNNGVPDYRKDKRFCMTEHCWAKHYRRK
jgi:hypothetical protein